MGRYAVTSKRMQGLKRSPNGYWSLRLSIPADVRAKFGKREFNQALNTTSENEAVRLGAGIVSAWKDQIAKARETIVSDSVLATGERGGLTHGRMAIRLDQATDAITKWTAAEMNRLWEEAFNSMLIPVSVEENNRLGLLTSALSANQFDQVDGFYAKLSAVLNAAYIKSDPDHPALKNLGRVFASAWLDIENVRLSLDAHCQAGIVLDSEVYDLLIRSRIEDRVSSAPLAVPPAVIPPVHVPPVGVPTASHGRQAMDLISLYEMWAESGHRKIEPRMKGYVERLDQILKFKSIEHISALDMDAAKKAISLWPNTKKPIDHLSYDEVIALADRENMARITDKTVWNWITNYKSMFDWAVSRDLMDRNPAALTMKKPAASQAAVRKPFADSDLAAIFDQGLFKGSDGFGYRNGIGSKIIKDHRYWLPILALWTGGRVEELASLQREEIKQIDGVWVIDLTERPITEDGERRVKNASARRIIPVHARLIDMGFIEFVQKTKPDENIFGLKPDSNGKYSSKFSKWWGLWCAETRVVTDDGLVFHSFRHTFKRAMRSTDVKEEIHDLISGHSEGNSVARGYGRGVDVKVLKAAIDKLDYPAFSL